MTPQLQHAIARYYGKGASIKGIAAELGVSEDDVLSVVSDGMPPEILEQEKVKVKNLIAFSAEAAAQALIGTLGSKSERIRQIAAVDLLDRAGFAPVQKSISLGMTAVIPAELLMMAKQAIEEERNGRSDRGSTTVVTPEQLA